jgi:hypothetical protein
MVLDVTSALGEAAALGLANTIHGPGGHYRRRARPEEPDHDHLAELGSAREFLAGHHVPVPAAQPTHLQLDRLRAVRDAIRALSDDSTSLDDWYAAMDRLLAKAAFKVSARGELRSSAAGWDALADDLLPPALQLATMRSRLRTCGNPLCRWLFVDRSRNRSRRWCEMAVCGNRVKVGRHRLRPVAAPPSHTSPWERRQPPR